MEQLEEKTELLFRLRKERQAIIEAECRMLIAPSEHQIKPTSKYYWNELRFSDYFTFKEFTLS